MLTLTMCPASMAKVLLFRKDRSAKIQLVFQEQETIEKKEK